MRKLKLDLDELDVESFAVRDEEEGEGTVHGHDTFFSTCCTYGSRCNTCGESCPGSCFESDCPTCQLETCYEPGC